MTKSTTVFLLLFLTLVFSNCSDNVNIIDFVDLNSQIKITKKFYSSDNPYTRMFESTLEPNTYKSEKLKAWSYRNYRNWNWSPASYVREKVELSQSNFRLLYYGDFVVVNFIDKEGNPQQYTHRINLGELDFLLE